MIKSRKAAMSVYPTRVNMLILMQPDLEKGVAFYQKNLGLRLIFHIKGKWAEFQFGDIKIGLAPIGQETAAPSHGHSARSCRSQCNV